MKEIGFQAAPDLQQRAPMKNQIVSRILLVPLLPGLLLVGPMAAAFPRMQAPTIRPYNQQPYQNPQFGYQQPSPFLNNRQLGAPALLQPTRMAPGQLGLNRQNLNRLQAPALLRPRGGGHASHPYYGGSRRGFGRGGGGFGFGFGGGGGFGSLLSGLFGILGNLFSGGGFSSPLSFGSASPMAAPRYANPPPLAGRFGQDTEAAPPTICENCRNQPQTLALNQLNDALTCQSRDPVECEMINDVNRIRRSQGLPAYRFDPICERAARVHGQDLARQGYFDHTARDGSQPWERYGRVGGRPRAVGENLYMASYNASPADANRSLMNSPGHRRAILSSQFTHMGVARTQGRCPNSGGTCTYYTQCFSVPGGGSPSLAPLAMM